MIYYIKLKMRRHHFDSLNASLQLYIPAFVNSNKIDVRSLDDREKLSRRVLVSLVDDLKHIFRRLAMREASKSITLKLTESLAIALYYLVQHIPGSKDDPYLSIVIDDVINQLHHDLVSPKPANKQNHFTTEESF